MYRTINIAIVVKKDDAKTLADHLREYISGLGLSNLVEVTVNKPYNREIAIVTRVAQAFEQKYPINTEVKLSKKGLNKNSFIKRPEVEPGTKGKVVGIDEGSALPFHVRFENGKTVYCSFQELEEV